jgi:hypothetical protein
MKRIELKLAVRAAERDVTIGWATGAALSLWRLLGLIAFARRSPAPISALGGFAFAEFLLVAALTIGVYQRRDWAAMSLAAAYGLAIAVRWALAGHLLPPVSLGTLLVGYGLYRGIRGTESLESLPAIERSQARSARA